MIDPLAGSRLKDTRALEHLKSLKTEIESFYKTEPYELTEVFNPQTGAYRLVVSKFTPLPRSWPVIVGDVLHNLRSMLDYIVWQLTVANGHHPPQFPLAKGSPWKRIQFPIFLDKSAFRRMRSNPRADQLWGIGDPACKLIERLQPFDNPEHPLWWLGELSNIDKHRMLPMTGEYLVNVWVHRPPSVRFIDAHHYRKPGFLDAKTEIAYVTFVPPPKSPVNVGHIQVMTVFDRGMPAEGQGVIDALGRMGVEANKVFKACRVYLRPRP